MFLFLYRIMTTLKVMKTTYRSTRWFPAPGVPIPSTTKVPLLEPLLLSPPPTASRPTADASATTTGTPTGTRRHTITVIAEIGCADFNELLETANLRHLVLENIGTPTEERVDLP
jgi:hypothetical protein